MQGKRKQEITPQFILSRISEWQIYRMYVPNFSLDRKTLSPFRREKSPSFKVVEKDGRLYYKDYGATEFRGGAFDLVSQLLSIDYPAALMRVAEDFGLIERKDGSRAERVEWSQPDVVGKPTIIQMEAWPRWRKEHRLYLRQYSLAPEDLQFCSDTRAYPVKSWALNGSIIAVNEDEPVFGYNLRNERGNWLKIYSPFRDKKDKWRSSIPFTEMHGIGNMEECDVGIITKSVKDAAFLTKYITPCVCVIQAEDIAAISVENMSYLKENCRNLYVALDCDKRGKEASHEITAQMGVKHVNPPDRLLEEKESDFSGMAKAWGVESVIKHFHKKHII